MAGQFKALTIRESAQFAKQKKRIQADDRRLDEQLLSITWVLAHTPNFFPVVKGKLHCAKTDPWPGAPLLRIYYTFDKNLVYLQSIEIIEESSNG